MKQAVIVTGASKGLGKALSEIYQNADLYLFSRSPISTSATLQKSIDLSKIDEIEPCFTPLFNDLKLKAYTEIILIHNAAMIEPIGFSGKQDHTTLINSLNVGFTAVLLITNLFINHFQPEQLEKKIFIISSGAAINAYPGWSHYCAAKAGINMFAETVFKEQEDQSFPIQIATFRPGVIDTGMQESIRKQPKEMFPIVEKFKSLRKDNLLRSPESVAKVIHSILKKPLEKCAYNINEFD